MKVVRKIRGSIMQISPRHSSVNNDIVPGNINYYIFSYVLAKPSANKSIVKGYCECRIVDRSTSRLSVGNECLLLTKSLIYLFFNFSIMISDMLYTYF